jgi:CheY-like chemotaxis protein/predicted Fe-Mo cluster-binding NifX family protein
MAKIAVPIFRSRVAPVFDYCVRVSVFEIDDDGQIERKELYLGTLSPVERVGALIKEGVTTLVCGGISDALYKMLQTSGIPVIGGKAGPLEEVLEAFMSDRIDEPQYYMPGTGGERYAPPQDRFEGDSDAGSVKGRKVSAGGPSQTGPGTPSKAAPKLRILLVERDVDTQKTAVHLLEKSGCKVDTVTTGTEAIKILEKGSYDLVFIDADTPEMDGYQATRVIRDPQSAVRCHQVPVIAIAGHEAEEKRKRWIEAGMDDCIFKPIEPQKLLEIIKMFPPESTSVADAK